MSHNPALPLSGLKPLLQRAAGRLHRTTQRERWFDLGWQWLALVAILFVLDLVFGLPVWARWAGLAVQAAFIVWRLRPILGTGGKKNIDIQRTARAVESKFPNSDNAFINAVQFSAALDSATETQALLMRREIERAEKFAPTVPLEEAVDRRGEVRSARLLAGAVGVVVLVAALFSGAFFAVMPRLFAPWMDDLTPPYSLTKIQISPAGAKVRYGDSLVISVQVSGPTLENLVLSTRTKNGKWQDVALESTEPGKYGATLETLHEDTTFFAKGGGARSARYVAHVVLPPEAQTLHAKYTYPSYLKRPAEAEDVGEKGIHGVRGTKTELEITANRELSGGELDVTYEDGREEKFALTASPDRPQVATTEMTIAGGGEYRVSLDGADGQVNPSAAKGKIVLEQVQGPSVWFVEPEQDILVTPTMHVAVQLDADADAGVEHMAMHRVINGIADNPVDLFKDAPEKHVEARRMLDLADLGVRPGDTITYFGAAYDATPGSPNFAETEPYTMKVVSDEEYKKTLKEERKSADLSKEVQDILNATDTLAKAQQEVAKKLNAAANQLAKNPNDAAAKKQFDAAKAEQAALQKQAEELAKQLQQYAQSPSASDAEAQVKKKVGEMGRQISQAAEAMKAGQSSSPGQASAEANKAANLLKSAAASGEKSAGKAVKHMEGMAPLFDDIQRFKDLLDRQGQLVLLSRQFQDHNPQTNEERTTLRHIADEQRRIGEDLKQLQSDFRTDGAAAAKNFPKAAASAQKIADEIGKRQIVETMQKGAGEFGQSHGPPGVGDALTALHQMEAMYSTCQSGQGTAEGELDIALSKSLGNSGLGASFGQEFNGPPGSKPGQGSGMAMGSRGGDRKGQVGGTTSSNEPHAYVMRTQSLHSGGSPEKVKSGNRAETQAQISPDSVEVVKSFASKPPKVSDQANVGYPPEYRKMVNDYFVSVFQGKKMIQVKRITTAGLALVLALMCFSQRSASGSTQEGDKVRAANLVYAVNKTSTCFSDRFLMRLKEETNIDTEPHLTRAKLGSDEVFKFPFAVMTGEGSYQLTPKERENLKYYVTHGGFLVASASCSDPEWIQSFREEMKRIFPDNPLRIIPLQHPIYRTVYNIASTATIHGRTGANLEGLFYHNKIVAIFSPDGINDTAHTQGCCCCGGDELNDAEYYNVNALAYALLH